MTLFYTGPAVRITHDVFESRFPTIRHFEICDLEDLHMVRNPTQLLRRRSYELRAQYRGRFVCLYRTTNRLEFGQVTRALRRALEYRAEVG